MSQLSQGLGGHGNTIHVPQSRVRARRWCFTFNNYTKSEHEHICVTCATSGWNYIIGKEVGANGTPHLQGYIECKEVIDFNKLKKINAKIHWEKARGSKEANINYCSKDGDYKTNFVIKEPVEDNLKGLTLYPWQQDIVNLMTSKPDKRKVYWYWDKYGHTGKTSLAKHLILTYPNQILFTGGKANDIKYGVASFLKNPKNDLKMCIFHYTRTVEGFVSYDALESIKDGIFFNSKYESDMCVFNSPHIVCFANFAPDVTKLSRDRWIIKEIN